MIIQSQGNSAEWSPENFRLCTTKPTRKSPRLNQTDTTPRLNQTDTAPQNRNYSSPQKF